MNIKIAGAGIAGMTAAINLAKSGIHVDLYDKANKVGSRFNGDLQALENWSSRKDIMERIKEFGINPTFEYHNIHNDFEIWTPYNRIPLDSKKKEYFYTIRRGTMPGTLDYSLFKQVQGQKNISLHMNSNIEDFSDIDIVATGPNIHDTNTDAIAAGYTFKTSYPNSGVILLDDSYAPDGYAYFLTLNGNAVVCIAIFNNFDKANEYRDRSFEFFKKTLNFDIKGELKDFGGIGNFFILDKKDKDKIYIGEAGGFQDFLLGFGMEYAMYSGYLAAKSIIKNLDYYNLVNKELYPRMKASVCNRLMFKILNNNVYYPFVKILNKEDIDIGLNNIYNLQWWHNLLWPLAKTFHWANIKSPIKK